jgi:hypothetical protein
MKNPPQCEVIMPRGDNNDNGKRKPMIQITGKKVIKLKKKREKLEKLQEVPQNTSQKKGFHNSNFAGILVQHRKALHHDEAILQLEEYGCLIDTPEWLGNNLWPESSPLDHWNHTDPGGYRWPPTFSSWLKTTF